MGEIKRQKKDIKMAIIVGLFCSYSIWLGCSLWIETPLMVSIILRFDCTWRNPPSEIY